jgi:hypothetical protein
VAEDFIFGGSAKTRRLRCQASGRRGARGRQLLNRLQAEVENFGHLKTSATQGFVSWFMMYAVIFSRLCWPRTM